MDEQAFNRAEIERIFSDAPFIRTLGLTPERVERGRCVTRIELAEHHQQQDGYVHAGVQASMADHSAGAAAGTLVAEGQLVLTAEFKINLLRAAAGDWLRCEAAVLKPGRSLIVAESEVYCGDTQRERLVAKATVTLAVAEKGR